MLTNTMQPWTDDPAPEHVRLPLPTSALILQLTKLHAQVF